MDETSSDKPPLRYRIKLFYLYLELLTDVFQIISYHIYFDVFDLTLYSKRILHQSSNKVLLCG